jgi:hypothetical protein
MVFLALAAIPFLNGPAEENQAGASRIGSLGNRAGCICVH